jgi:hypothetical protein
MSRRAPVVFLATALVWGASACQPSQPSQQPQPSPSPQLPPDDTAVGKGVYSAGAEEWEFRFDVRSRNNGDDASGIMILERTDGIFSVRAEAFCLAATQSQAAMVGDIYNQKNFPGFEELVIKVEDSAVAAPPDSIAHSLHDEGKGLAQCSPQTPPHPIDSGTIDVHDEP